MSHCVLCVFLGGGKERFFCEGYSLSSLSGAVLFQCFFFSLLSADNGICSLVR